MDFQTKEQFEEYWNQNYIPVVYDDVKAAFESYVKVVDKHIFIEDYEAAGAITKDTFLKNLNQSAVFTFQDVLTEVFYEKNKDLYETAFEIFEKEQMEGNTSSNTTQVFHEEYYRLYEEFLGKLFDSFF